MLVKFVGSLLGFESFFHRFLHFHLPPKASANISFALICSLFKIIHAEIVLG